MRAAPARRVVLDGDDLSLPLGLRSACAVKTAAGNPPAQALGRDAFHRVRDLCGKGSLGRGGTRPYRAGIEAFPFPGHAVRNDIP
jgi:hypothetical protein